MAETKTLQEQVEAFFEGTSFAVAGASVNRDKYGNKVLRLYQQKGLTVYPLNPKSETIEGLTAYASLADLPESIHGLSIITPPAITETIIDQAIELGIQHLWIQPGAEHAEAIARARAAGVNVIADGPCILVLAGYHE